MAAAGRSGGVAASVRTQQPAVPPRLLLLCLLLRGSWLTVEGRRHGAAGVLHRRGRRAALAVSVRQHAHASTVRVAVRAAGAHITVDVQDDGVGFDPNRRTAGFGLAGMSERVHIAGGALELDSNQNGTRIHVSLPARNASQGEASTAAS
jgi:nitrogen-specific signal transduction histidine kinase